MGKSKLNWKRNWEQLKIEQRETTSNRIVKKYSSLTGKTYKTKEISMLIGKAESVVRKLKQKALKKMKITCQKRGFDKLL